MNPLSVFLRGSLNDYRISSTHIGVFAALVQYSTDRGNINPYRAYSYEIMKIARISSLKTYSRCMQDLHAYGYLSYEPSKKKNLASRIWFNE
jgi:hypothetical protein